jgi:hypothetical protein
MSVILEQENLVELQVVPVLDDRTERNISTIITRSIDQILTTGVSNIISQVKPVVQKPSQVISSPQELKTNFTKLFIKNVGEVNSENSLISQKAAVVRTLQSLDYKMENPEMVVSELKTVMKSSTIKELKSEINSLMENIQVQHTNYLIKNAISHIKQATINVGFAEDLRINEDGDKTVVVASKNGKALLTEINFDPEKNKIDISSEAINFEGDGCSQVMEAFEKELVDRGLKFSSSNKKSTGGKPWLPSAKTIQKEIKAKRAIQQRSTDRQRQDLKRKSQTQQKLRQ